MPAPLIGEAWNVTRLPAHMPVADALILTDGDTPVPTVIVMVFETTGVLLPQLCEGAIVSLMLSPFASVVV